MVKLLLGCNIVFVGFLSPTRAVTRKLGPPIRRFRDNHKVEVGKKRSKTNGIKLGKMTSGCGCPESAGFFDQSLS